MNMKDVKFINNGDIIYYREKYYTVTRINMSDYSDDKDDLNIEAEMVLALNEDK